jgi:hypothetical protein
VSRPHVEVAVPALALRRAQAAAALGVSLEVFDRHVRPHVAAAQVGGVLVYPVAELQRFLTESSAGYDEADNTGGAAVREHPAPWPDRR